MNEQYKALNTIVELLWNINKWYFNEYEKELDILYKMIDQNMELKHKLEILYEWCFLINVHRDKIKKKGMVERAKHNYYSILNDKEKLGIK